MYAEAKHLGLEWWACSCRKTGQGTKPAVVAVEVAAVAAVAEGVAAVVEAGGTRMKKRTPAPQKKIHLLLHINS